MTCEISFFQWKTFAGVTIPSQTFITISGSGLYGIFRKFCTLVFGWEGHFEVGWKKGPLSQQISMGDSADNPLVPSGVIWNTNVVLFVHCCEIEYLSNSVDHEEWLFSTRKKSLNHSCTLSKENVSLLCCPLPPDFHLQTGRLMQGLSLQL